MNEIRFMIVTLDEDGLRHYYNSGDFSVMFNMQYGTRYKCIAKAESDAQYVRDNVAGLTTVMQVKQDASSWRVSHFNDIQC